MLHRGQQVGGGGLLGAEKEVKLKESFCLLAKISSLLLSSPSQAEEKFQKKILIGGKKVIEGARELVPGTRYKLSAPNSVLS